ncbi:MAG: 5'-nucleotidase C-terminal domain-containing protein [Candidatus Hatepunaea meridiana]|nr:5'-nucleotidase C-terminal domain-containing protein [Candidatus Hatepunaea meridiana]
MIKSTVRIISIAFLVLAVYGQLSARQLTLLYWGDRLAHDLPYVEIVNGETVQIGGAGALAGMVNAIKANDPHTLVMVAGGEFAGSPVSLLTQGQSQVSILNKIGIDAFVPGEYEFAYSWESLETAMNKADFPVLLSNVIDGGSFKPMFTPDTLFYLPGVIVGVIGVINPEFKKFVDFDGVLGIGYIDYLPIITEFVKRKRKSCDVLVVLSYLGWEMDSLLAVQVPGLDVIIGSRGDNPFDPPREVNGVIIARSGHYGRWLGRLVVNVDTTHGGIINYKGSLLSVEQGQITIDEEVEKLVAKLEKKHTKKMNKKIGTLQTDWKIAFDKPSNLAQWAADIMHMIYSKIDLAVINNGCLMGGLKKGPITELDMWKICPYETPIVITQISGRELNRVLDYLLIKNGEFITWSGLEILVRNNEVVKYLINGKPVNPSRDYALATTGQVWGNIENHLRLIRGERPCLFLPGINLRQVLTDAVRSIEIISNPLDDRWVVE